MLDYEIGAAIPVQLGRGKMGKGKDNTESVAKSARKRNEEYGFIEIRAENTITKKEEREDR